MSGPNPPFVLHIHVLGYNYTPMIWRVRRHMRPGGIPAPGYGAPTDANLAKYISDFEKSCLTGVNKHLGEQIVQKARITRQSTGETVARYTKATTMKKKNDPVMTTEECDSILLDKPLSQIVAKANERSAKDPS